MIAFGGLTALYNSSTYGAGVEVTSPQHGSTMYFAVSVFNGIGCLAAPYVACKHNSCYILYCLNN